MSRFEWKLLGVALLLTAVLLTWLAFASSVARATPGACGFASAVASYSPGADLPTSSPNRDPSKALGDEDAQWVSLGQGGSIVLEFVPPIAVGAGTDIDFQSIEIQHNEGAFFEVSEDGVTFVALGLGIGNATFDISSSGLSTVSFVRVIDDNDGVGTGSMTSGFDLDAVIVYNCGPVTPPEPGIDIEKFTNGEDADTPTGPIIPVGDAVAWTYVVTNTGNVPLSNVTVTDNQGVVVSCPKTTLAPGESMNCTGSGTAVAGQYANIGTATGTPPVGPDVSDSDASHYFGQLRAGGKGCTPGYWKQSHHFDSWVGYSPSDSFEAVFGVNVTYGNPTLLDALRRGGGGEKALGRHAVAALLNASNSGVPYLYSVAQVIAIVQNAYATGDFEGAKALLEAQNELGCPLN